ncbi:MobQ family relaxase [Methylocystis sp. ATCC 49242]|uniref:MobQ family relaxase n=1 Tax=Methylocystis sp. ATCC 49242 TaxID=622637 RepID=UPI0001F86AFD|nr:MobQ family relaxase [Methylocystis sp. ATCC 49242]
MAIPHLTVKCLSRTKNYSATAAAAYRAGTRIVCARGAVTHDYTRKRGVAYTEIIVPPAAAWARDRSVLWNAAEEAENRKNSVIAREYELALPHELSAQGRVALAREFAEHVSGRFGVAADVAIHAPHRRGDARNWHAHILTTTRVVVSGGLGAKTRVLDDKTTSSREVMALRLAWERMVNEALEREQLAARISMRSLQAQRREAEARAAAHRRQGEADRARLAEAEAIALDRPRESHVGVAAMAIERRAQQEAAQAGVAYTPATRFGALREIVRGRRAAAEEAARRHVAAQKEPVVSADPEAVFERTMDGGRDVTRVEILPVADAEARRESVVDDAKNVLSEGAPAAHPEGEQEAIHERPVASLTRAERVVRAANIRSRKDELENTWRRQRSLVPEWFFEQHGDLAAAQQRVRLAREKLAERDRRLDALRAMVLEFIAKLRGESSGEESGSDAAPAAVLEFAYVTGKDGARQRPSFTVDDLWKALVAIVGELKAALTGWRLVANWRAGKEIDARLRALEPEAVKAGEEQQEIWGDAALANAAENLATADQAVLTARSCARREWAKSVAEPDELAWLRDLPADEIEEAEALVKKQRAAEAEERELAERREKAATTLKELRAEADRAREAFEGWLGGASYRGLRNARHVSQEDRARLDELVEEARRQLRALRTQPVDRKTDAIQILEAEQSAMAAFREARSAAYAMAAGLMRDEGPGVDFGF